MSDRQQPFGGIDDDTRKEAEKQSEKLQQEGADLQKKAEQVRKDVESGKLTSDEAATPPV